MKLDGDGWGCINNLWGRVGMGVSSVPMQDSMLYYTKSHSVHNEKEIIMGGNISRDTHMHIMVGDTLVTTVTLATCLARCDLHA